MKKKESEYRWIFFIVLAFLAPIFLIPNEIWYRIPGVRRLLTAMADKNNTGLWNGLNSADASRSSNNGNPRGWMPLIAKSSRTYGTEGGLIGEKHGADYGEETDGVAAEKDTDADAVDQQPVGEDERIAGAGGTDGNAGYASGISGIGMGMGAGGQSGGGMSSSSAGGSSGASTNAGKLASKGSTASRPLKRGQSLLAKRLGRSGTKAQDITTSSKTLGTAFAAGSQGQTPGDTNGIPPGQTPIGPGGNPNPNPGGGGIGGPIVAPPPGPGKPADPHDDDKPDKCKALYDKCLQIAGDYDRKIQSKEAEFQTCTTWVNMGKSGWVQVIDQACFNRVNADLLDLRKERDLAVAKCQQGQDNCKK
ncbi:MAG: hypothetical protein WCU88_12860 [Elusimicrobiota bacterium]|jgi:hypothetical protein